MRLRWPRRCLSVKGQCTDETGPRMLPCAEQQWRAAEMMAREAELRVERAWAAYLASGDAVPEAILTQARSLRIVATERLAAWLLQCTHRPGA